MENYSTPVHKKKTRLLGMTLQQIGLLAGLLVVQAIILVLALRFVVFAPQEEIPPTVTPIVLAQLPTLPPTPVPDLTTAVLTIDDLPGHFAPAPKSGSQELDFNANYPGIALRPVNSFAFIETEALQVLLGWTFSFVTPDEQQKFDALIADPVPLISAAYVPGEGSAMEFSTPAPLEGQIYVGKRSSGWRIVAAEPDLFMNIDLVLYSDNGYGGIAMLIYRVSEQPVVSAWEVARKMESRVRDVLVSGPIPPPFTLSVDTLARLTLTQEDLTPEFQVITDLAMEAETRASLAEDGFHVAGVFGYEYTKPDREELVWGFTFVISDTLTKDTMNAFMSSDEFLFSLQMDSEDERVERRTLGKPIGDAAFLFAFMPIGAATPVRTDMLIFRRGYVGVATYHAYHTGVWKITLEDLARKVDAKIQALAAP